MRQGWNGFICRTATGFPWMPFIYFYGSLIACSILPRQGSHLSGGKGFNASQKVHPSYADVPFHSRASDRYARPCLQNYDPDQQAAFRVFNGENVGRLRRFLDKEDLRRRDAEAKNIPFVTRSDDKLDLY